MKDFHVFLISFKPVIMMFEAKESRGLRLKISSNGRLNRQELTIKRLSYMRGLRLLRIIINFAMVFTDFCLYFRNRRLDRQREAGR